MFSVIFDDARFLTGTAVRGVGAGVDALEELAVELPSPLTPFKVGNAALLFAFGVGIGDGTEFAGVVPLAPHATGFGVVGLGPLPRAGKSPSDLRFGRTDGFLRCFEDGEEGG